MTDMHMSQDRIDFYKSLENYKPTAYDGGFGKFTVRWRHTSYSCEGHSIPFQSTLVTTEAVLLCHFAS